MTFFPTLLWKMQAHLQNVLQDIEVEFLSVAFCMYIQNWKQFDKQMWLISLLLLFLFYSIHIRNLSETSILKNIAGSQKKPQQTESELSKLQDINQLGRNYFFNVNL